MKRKNPKMEELDCNFHANLICKYEINNAHYKIT